MLDDMADAEGALGFLDCLCARDPHFYGYHQPDDENRLANIFWADGAARRDYKAFGDVISFDTTYMTNMYNKPLCIIVGVNHHFTTCLFGFPLLMNEKELSYSWMLQAFLECHGQVKPKVVVTDGDHAMYDAITTHLPQSTHRLCCWHLSTNANRAGGGDPEFTKAFSNLMYRCYKEEVFESKWR
ncbi:hypothetical protein CsatA_009946 [Cannabis sativa]